MISLYTMCLWKLKSETESRSVGAGVGKGGWGSCLPGTGLPWEMCRSWKRADSCTAV